MNSPRFKSIAFNQQALKVTKQRSSSNKREKEERVDINEDPIAVIMEYRNEYKFQKISK